jgi:hypothetical protein
MNARAILIGGIVASLAIAMWEMVVEAVIPDWSRFGASDRSYSLGAA